MKIRYKSFHFNPESGGNDRGTPSSMATLAPENLLPMWYRDTNSGHMNAHIRVGKVSGRIGITSAGFQKTGVDQTPAAVLEPWIDSDIALINSETSNGLIIARTWCPSARFRNAGSSALENAMIT